MQATRSIFWKACSLLAIVLLLAGCNAGSIPQTGANLPVLTLDLNDTAITAPGPMAPGIVRVNINNTGQAPRTVTLARLNTGVTLEQFMQTLTTDDMAAVALVALAGGTDAPPGEPASFMTDLKTGTYAVISFPESDQPPLTTSFEVNGTASTALAPPETQGSVDLLDFSFNLPEPVEAGPLTWEVTNSGAQWHEIVVFKLQPGQTQEDFIGLLMSDTQPATEPEQLLYFGPITQGERGWVTFDLTAGSYIAVCFLPDVVGGGESHVEKGMVQTFTVE